MSFRFKTMPEFDKNFSNLQTEFQERIRKKLEEFKNAPIQKANLDLNLDRNRWLSLLRKSLNPQNQIKN